MKQQIFYDAWDRSCKDPFGAVKAGQTVSITVRVDPSLDTHGAAIVLRADKEAQGKRLLMRRTGGTDHFITYEISFSVEETGLYFYRFELEVDTGLLFIGCGENGTAAIGDFLPEWQLTVFDPAFDTSEKVPNGVMYQIFPDRFLRGSSDPLPPTRSKRIIHDSFCERPLCAQDDPKYDATDFFGGDFAGIRQKLPMLSALGVRSIYLNPIFESASNHRYGTADYFSIDPYLGDERDFRALCEEAKSLGIAIILDGVFSHTGSDSIYFNMDNHYDSLGAYQSPESPYAKWYRFSDDRKKYDCWWDFPNLPNVNEEDPDYLQFICGENGVLRHWMRLGASGWRLDVADELPDCFLYELRKAVKAQDPDAYILGEVWEDASNKESYGVRRPYLLGAQLDSVMNYPWRTAILDFVKEGKAQEFYTTVQTLLDHYPQPAIDTLMNPLSTHDTPRAITVLGLEREIALADRPDHVMTDEEYARGSLRLKLASMVQYLLPGFPSLYYADEAGLYGFADPFNRRCYPWETVDTALTEFFRKLGAVRTEFAEHLCKPLRFFHVADGQIAFLRGDSILLAVNVSEQTLSLPVQAERILLSVGETKLSGDTVCLPKDAAAILLLQTPDVPRI